MSSPGSSESLSGQVETEHLGLIEGCLDKCIDRYLEPGYPSATLREVLSIAHDPVCYPKDLVPPVLKNSAVRELVFRTDFLRNRIQEWISESPEGAYVPSVILERTFTLLGRQASRNLIACIEIQRMTGSLPKKAEERLSVRPSEQIRYAVAAEEFCQNRRFASSEMAFVGGFHFDLLHAALQKQRGPREVIREFPQVFAESLRAAHAAYEIGSRVGEFSFSPLIFPAALSAGLGRTLMASLYPKDLLSRSYSSFLMEGEKLKEMKAAHLVHRELPRFGVQAAELSALYVSWMELFGKVEAAIRYMHEPHYLRKHSTDLMRLACVIQLAYVLAEGAPFSEKHHASLRTLGLKEADVLSAWNLAKAGPSTGS